MKTYDVVIIGGGVTGCAALYVLSNYTNVKRIALIEKYPEIACVQSSKDNNSQTLHFGDIETNYTLQKAKRVKEGADLVKGYVLQHGNHLYKKFHKMVLGVGKKEVKYLTKRQEEFKTLFPDLRLIGRKELANIEPKLTIGRDTNTPIIAQFTDEGYAVNFGELAKSFVKEAKKVRNDIDINLASPVKNVIYKNGFYHIITKRREIKTKVLIVSASANTLTIAKKLGYGQDIILFPVAGSFFIAPKLLHGKVYMVQNPKMPFASIHGDPDVVNPAQTRFGPIARVVPMLERRRYNSIIDFMRLFQFKWSAITSILHVLADSVYLTYVLWNVLYDIPFLGKYIFLREVRKIIPSIKAHQLTYARKIGGTRPQVINTKTKKLEMGTAKFFGKNAIFNITPSPGASICLKNAQEDVQKTMEFLGQRYTFNIKKFKEDLSV
jgi:malate dehydrogenase (quinone)